jgi:hypothetical protein
MKYKFYCAINEDISVINFLKTKKIKYETGPLPNRIYFTIYSDIENNEELLKYIQTLPETSIEKSSVFSEQEMEDANWYLLYVTRMGMETKNVDYTYNAKCPYTTAYGMQRHYHLDQVNPFVSTKTPKWKNGYNFCSVETGFMTQIFCSDFAKDTILKSEISGVSFMPVLKKDLKTEISDVHQLVFANKLPLEAYTFIGKYSEDVCPFCGRINYIFEEPNCDNVKLNTDKIPKNIDAFGSEIIIGYGFGDEPIVISKKFYNLIMKEIKEKPKHFIIYPIA